MRPESNQTSIILFRKKSERREIFKRVDVFVLLGKFESVGLLEGVEGIEDGLDEEGTGGATEEEEFFGVFDFLRGAVLEGALGAGVFGGDGTEHREGLGGGRNRWTDFSWRREVVEKRSRRKHWGSFAEMPLVNFFATGKSLTCSSMLRVSLMRNNFH